MTFSDCIGTIKFCRITGFKWYVSREFEIDTVIFRLNGPYNEYKITSIGCFCSIKTDSFKKVNRKWGWLESLSKHDLETSKPVFELVYFQVSIFIFNLGKTELQKCLICLKNRWRYTCPKCQVYYWLVSKSKYLANVCDFKGFSVSL